MTWFLLYSFGFQYSHILYGTIQIVGDDALYLVHNLQALKDLAKQEMGSSYSDYAFHQFFLECGPSDFNSLTERLKEE